MATQYVNETRRVIHVRFDGRSFDVPLEALGVSGKAADRAVREAVATCSSSAATTTRCRTSCPC